ncbi:hypothetical protein GCM10029978_066540 [Actinoallomurus acanthiterrae]
MPGGFVAYALDDAGHFAAIGLDADTGRIRWRHAATPSYLAGGEGLDLIARDDVVVFIASSGVYELGGAQVLAVDPGSGRRLWSYGRPGQRIIAQLQWCAEGQRVCFVTTHADFSRSELVVVDAADGRVVARREVGDGRRISDELYAADSGRLMRVDAAGHRVWLRSTAEVFGRDGLSVDAGWDIRRQGDRYIGWLGHREDPPTPRHVQQLGAGAVAAFDAATGRRLWSRTGVETICGGIDFDPRHPMWCRTSGSVEWGPNLRPRVSGVDVTFEGFDATGRIRWSWHASAIPGLFSTANATLRIDDTTYLVHSPKGLMRLDLDNGVRAVTGALASGWCSDQHGVRPSQTIKATGWSSYVTRRFWPCDTSGEAIPVPPTTPTFAGTRVGERYVWPDRNAIRAVTIGQRS